MLQKIKNTILQISEVAAVEVLTNPDGSFLINAVVVNLKKTELIKRSEWINILNIEELSLKLSPKIPLTIVITGKNVLVKSIPFRENISNYISEILPQANPNEFYYSAVRQQETLLVSITRKEFVDNTISQLLSKGYKVLDASLAFFDVLTLFPYLTSETTGSIEVPAYYIEYNQHNTISSFQTTNFKKFDLFAQKEYAVANQYIKAPLILAFAAASKIIAGSISAKTHLSSPVLMNQRNEYKYFKYFKAASWLLFTGLFSLLLINFFFYSYYFNKSKEISSLQVLSMEQTGELKKRVMEMKRKETFLAETGWVKASKTSYFADRIASLVTSDLYLTSLQIYPANSPSVLEKNESSYKKDTIQITGNCAEPLQLNQFTNNLKNLSEVKDVVVKNYLYKKENDNGSFLIEIITK